MGTLGIDAADLPGLVQEEADVIGDALDQPRGVAPAPVVLHDVDGLVNHRAEVVGVGLEVFHRADDAAAPGCGHSAIAGFEGYRYPASRLVTVALQLVIDPRVPALADAGRLLGPFFQLRSVGDIDGELDRV